MVESSRVWDGTCGVFGGFLVSGDKGKGCNGYDMGKAKRDEGLPAREKKYGKMANNYGKAERLVSRAMIIAKIRRKYEWN